MEKTIEECKAHIQSFANKHKLIFDDEGQVGFGRDCVGLKHGDNYVDFNPCNSMTYESIEEFHDERLYEIAPADAYHKHDCLAVLGHGDDSIRQLCEWIEKLEALGATIESFATGATGIQAMLSGFTKMTVKIPK